MMKKNARVRKERRDTEEKETSERERERESLVGRVLLIRLRTN